MLLLELVLFGYSFFYQYETPTYLGTSALYASNLWYMPAVLTYSNYKGSITLTGIIPHSHWDLKHSDVSAFYRVKHFYLLSGLRIRNLSNIYNETTGIIGGAVKAQNVAASLDIRAILQSLNNEEKFIKTTLDASFIFHKRPIIIGYFISNLLRPKLDFSQIEESSMAERALFAINFPQEFFFTLGYEKEKQYETPLLSFEVWFTRGFNVTFGIENNAVEGGIGLKSERLSVNVRVKSHTILGPTYISQITLYNE